MQRRLMCSPLPIPSTLKKWTESGISCCREAGPFTRAALLALWVPHRISSIHRLEDLASPAVQPLTWRIPKLAPYGKAAVDALQHAHVWDQVEPKVVYAENINMAKQYGVSATPTPC